MNITALLGLTLLLAPGINNSLSSSDTNVNNEETFTIKDEEGNVIEQGADTWQIVQSGTGEDELHIKGENYVVSGTYNHAVICYCNTITLSYFNVNVSGLEFAFSAPSNGTLFINGNVSIINQNHSNMDCGIYAPNTTIKTKGNDSVLSTDSFYAPDYNLILDDEKLTLNAGPCVIGNLTINNSTMNCTLVDASAITINNAVLNINHKKDSDRIPCLVFQRKEMGDLILNSGRLVVVTLYVDHEGNHIPAIAAYNITLNENIKAYGSHEEYEEPSKFYTGKIGTGPETAFGTSKSIVDESDKPFNYVILEDESHHFLDFVDGKAATCIEPGFKQCYKCKACNEYYEDKECSKKIDNYDAWIAKGGGGYIAPLGHELLLVLGKSPTCDQPGFKQCYKCNKCNEYFEDIAGKNAISNYEEWIAKGGAGYIAPLGHNLKLILGKAATCVQSGYKECYKCDTCNEYFEDSIGSVEIKDYQAWISKGGAGYIAPLGHNLNLVPGKVATCEESGYRDCYKCLVCNEYFEDIEAKIIINNYESWIKEGGAGYIAPLGHNLKAIPGKDPTCDEAGYKECFKCINCNEYFEDSERKIEIKNYEAWIAEGGAGYIAPLGHNLKLVPGKVATCDCAGYKECYKCENCNKYFEDIEAKIEIKDYQAWIAKGGAGYIEPTEHELIKHKGKEASFFEAGWHDYYECTKCKKFYDDLDGAGKYYYIEDLEAWKLGRGAIPKLNLAGIVGGSIAGAAILIGGASAIIIYNKKKHRASK